MSDGSFEKFEAREWSAALSKTVPSITATAKNASKSSAPLGVAGGRARKAKKIVRGAATKPVANAATSSGT